MAAAKVVWFLGLQSGIIGPTLGGMAELVGQASGTALAAQFSFRSAGFLLGTLAVGVVFDASARQHLFTALATAGLALGLACLPLMPSREAMYALWVPAGVCMGFVDTGVNLLVLDAWKGCNSTPWMNLLHFMWGVGSFISPLQLTFVSVPASFRLVAVVGLATACCPLVLSSPATRNPRCIAERAARGQKQAGSAEGNDGGGTEGGGERFLLATVACFGVFMFYVGLEAGFGSWLATFLVELSITDAEGAALATSVYWGSLTAGRLVAVPLAVYVRPAVLIAIDLAAAVATCAVFTLVRSSHATMLGVAVAIGLSLASVFASTLAVAATRMPFTGRRASFCIAGASSGQVTLPYAIGSCFRRFGPGVFPLCCLGLAAGASCCFLLLASRPVRAEREAEPAAASEEEKESLIADG